MYAMLSLRVFSTLVLLAPATPAEPQGTVRGHVADEVSVVVLSTNLADAGVGEWGFSALVKADDACILFDTGRYPQTVLQNADRLDADLGCVEDVVLSHWHSDHIGGAATLVEEILRRNGGVPVRVHVARRFFDERRSSRGSAYTVHHRTGEALRSLGAEIIEHDGPAEIKPGVWITGPIARTHDERNWGAGVLLLEDGAWVEDYLPDDQALTIVTEEGHIVVVGCGHAGTVNTLEAVQSSITDAPIHALIGGLHLFQADDETLAWTAERMAAMNVENLMGGHCTGIEAVFRLRAQAGLKRETAVVAAVGSSFELGRGIHPRGLAR